MLDILFGFVNYFLTKGNDYGFNMSIQLNYEEAAKLRQNRLTTTSNLRFTLLPLKSWH